MSKILLGDIVWLSLRWFMEADCMWIWNRSIEFKWGPFFWKCSICMTSWIFPKEWLISIKCCANYEVWLLFRNERLCSLYLVMKFCLFVLYILSYSQGKLVCTHQYKTHTDFIYIQLYDSVLTVFSNIVKIKMHYLIPVDFRISLHHSHPLLYMI